MSFDNPNQPNFHDLANLMRELKDLDPTDAELQELFGDEDLTAMFGADNQVRLLQMQLQAVLETLSKLSSGRQIDPTEYAILGRLDVHLTATMLDAEDLQQFYQGTAAAAAPN